MTDEEKVQVHKDTVKKYIDKLYGTASVTAEANYTEELIKEVKKLDKKDLVDFASTLDVFGKCVLHYRLPIDMRLDVAFSKATEVSEEERLAYWKEYKEKLKNMNKGPEEEYDKIILMACTLHVPIDPVEEENVEEPEMIDVEKADETKVNN